MCPFKINVILNALGLILDILGALLMFEKINVALFVYNESEVSEVNKRKNRKINGGIWLLISGFFLQLLALFS